MKNRKQNRHPYWDYSNQGVYFITICTKNRKHFFGKIFNGAMVLNEIGKIAHDFWREIPNHFPHIELLDFVVMPNHVHGIVCILGNTTVGNSDRCSLRSFRPPRSRSETETKRNSQKIPIVISQYKSSVTRFVRKQFGNHEFSWQRSYHDHIVRNEKSLARICEYIRRNPERWDCDRSNEVGVWG